MPTDIGIIDLGMGFPYQSVDEKKAAYDFFRPLLRDRQSRDSSSSRPSTCSRTRPTSSSPDDDPVAWTVDKMDEFGIDAGDGRHVAAAASGPSGSTPAGSSSCRWIRTGASTPCAS